MITTTSKLIAALAISLGLLTTSAALAKGSPGHSGGGNSGSMKSSSNFSAFKVKTNTTSLNNTSNSISGISKKPVTLSQNFKKQDFNKDPKNSSLAKSLNSIKVEKKFDKKVDKKFDKNWKDFFCKKENKCWFDWCYPTNHCYPYYFDCYYPLFSCYDYCTPTYTTCNYTCSSLAVLPTVEPSRTLVSVGSVLLINGQVFGDRAGGARLRLNGMAMPIEVLEWTPAGVKVRLPQIEIGGVTPAEIEVIRGDGSLASKTPIDLTAAPEQLALSR